MVGLIRIVVATIVLVAGAYSTAVDAQNTEVEPGFQLQDRRLVVQVDRTLRLSVARRDGTDLIDSAKSALPRVTVRGRDGATQSFALSDAASVSCSEFSEAKYKGKTLRLQDFGNTDVVLDVAFGLDRGADELLVQVAQSGGLDTVVSVDQLYRFEKPTADGGYMVLPRGSGYLVHADSPDEYPGTGTNSTLIGSHWSMPWFGIVNERISMCAIVDTWWDCQVKASHVPGVQSSLEFNWIDSLGKLDYPRRILFRFDKNMDYAKMAKVYRRYATRQGLVKTLEQKSAQSPVIRDWVKGILFRWSAWNETDGETVLEDIRRIQAMGLNVNFFFPKWSSAGYAAGRNTATTADAGWKAYLLDNPVPGGWPVLVDYAKKISDRGCPIQLMLMHEKNPGEALAKVKQVLDNIQTKGLNVDVIYYDGFSAYNSLHEIIVECKASRREAFEVQSACFAETRSRGMIPAGELARFWAIPNCDHFFFSDWSNDRLANTPNKGPKASVGEPVPLFQLVFHDCYTAGFSGGGYAIYAPGYDWWPDRTPRLYELMFASLPALNWLPQGYVPIRNWDLQATKNHVAWLKKWNAYYSAIAMSEMLSHKFLTTDRKIQQVRYANGVVAEFDMTSGKYRIKGVAGFTGDWELPEQL